MAPLAKCCARSAMYSVLRSDRPQARNSGRGLASTISGVTVPTQVTSRSQTLCAAFTEICWPTMARVSVWNGSPRGRRNTFGCSRMIPAMVGSFLASARFARSQYSGFMDRQVDEQVLRLHAHGALFGRRKREVHGAAGNVAAHRRRILECEREEREDALHASLLD